jgi:hypothetical protein
MLQLQRAACFSFSANVFRHRVPVPNTAEGILLFAFRYATLSD